MITTLAQNARDVGSIPALGTLFPIFLTHMCNLAFSALNPLHVRKHRILYEEINKHIINDLSQSNPGAKKQFIC